MGDRQADRPADKGTDLADGQIAAHSSYLKIVDLMKNISELMLGSKLARFIYEK